MYGNPVLEEMTHYPTMLKRIQLYSFLCSNIDESLFKYRRICRHISATGMRKDRRWPSTKYDPEVGTVY